MSGSVRKGIWPKLPLLLFLVVAVAGLASLGRSAEVARAETTLNVNTTDDNPAANCATPASPCSLRGAINRANASAVDVTIVLPSGTFLITRPVVDEEPGEDEDDDNVGGDFDIYLSTDIDVVIVGAGPGSTFIDGGGLKRVLDVYDLADGSLTLRNLTLRNGYMSDDSGGCLYVEDGPVTLENVVVEGCVADYYEDGGGIYVYTGDLIIQGTVTVRNNTSASGDGGGIYNYDHLTIADGATLIVEQNYAAYDGGGIYNDDEIKLAGTATAPAQLIVRNNTTDDGDGGGIYNGGNIERASDTAISVVVVSGNEAGGSGSGGGIYDSGGGLGTSTMPLINVVVSGNRAAYGAGIYGGSVYLAAATISGNEVTDEDGNGGGIGLGLATNTLELTNVTISGNRAGSGEGDGGGIWAGGADTVTLNFVTVANNRAGSGGYGGGIYFADSVGKTVSAAILADNTAGEEGPDCYVLTGTLTLSYSVVKGDLDDQPNCTDGTGTVDETDPQLRPLGNYGGAVQTHAIPATSPAVDRVPEGASPCENTSPPAPQRDARGVVRNGTGTADAIDGNLDGSRGCDAGAFESTPVDISVIKADAPDPAFSGGTLAYTLTVSVASLAGSNWATGVVLTDTLPAGTAFQSVQVNPSSAGSCSPAGGTVTCSFANIADGGSVTITINVQVTAPGGSLTNTATLAMNEADPATGNNSATATTAVAFGGAPAAPTMVAIWPGSSTQAMITWQVPSGVVTFYRLQSSLNFEFTFGVTTTDIPVGSLPFPGNIIGVGLPTADGLTFYYRLAACNSLGCSPFAFAGALAARQFPAGTTEHWNFVMGAFEFAGTVFAWGQNQVSVAGKNSDFNFYDGVQGFGGVLKGSCAAVAPGSSCTQSWAAGSPFVSVSQAFPPFGEVGVAVRTH